MKAKIAVINFSGNVGKSTIARHLLSSRLDDPQMIAVESINAGSNEEDITTVRGKEFRRISDNLMLVDSAIVDVGASNVEDYIRYMSQFAGSHEDYDFFLVPTVVDRKQQIDTVATIKALAAIGVPADKIKLVFNKVETDTDVENDFEVLIRFLNDSKIGTLNLDAVIYASDFYGMIRKGDKTAADVAADSTDYRELIRQAPTDEEKGALIPKLQLKRLSLSVNQNLDKVFAALFNK
jgi:hypothetical protein